MSRITACAMHSAGRSGNCQKSYTALPRLMGKQRKRHQLSRLALAVSAVTAGLLLFKDAAADDAWIQISSTSSLNGNYYYATSPDTRTTDSSFSLTGGSWLVGTYIASGDVSGTTLTITSASTSTNSSCSGRCDIKLVGGYAANGAARGNKLNFEGKINLTQTGMPSLYGGYAAKGSATGNYLTLTGAAITINTDYIELYGGYSLASSASDITSCADANVVSVTGGSFSLPNNNLNSAKIIIV